MHGGDCIEASREVRVADFLRYLGTVDISTRDYAILTEKELEIEDEVCSDLFDI